MLTVLCIGNNGPSVATLEDTLRAEGFRVLTARNGEGGIAVAGQHKFNVVVLDYHLPDMNGEEVARRLKQQDPELPIILCSGLDDIPESVFAMVDALVMKGVMPEFLSLTIKYMLERNRITQIHDWIKV